MTLRIGFMGTPDFAVPAFEAILAAGHDIVLAWTQPPRPAGRGRRLRPSPVQCAAEAAAVPVRSPRSLKGEVLPPLDAIVVAAYGLILPPPFLAAPRRGCLNIHASLLPRWRGAAPIQRAIMAGDPETGITIMRMDAGLDTGPMLSQRAISIAGQDAGELHDRLAALGARMIVDALAGDFPEIPQCEGDAVYARKLTAADEIIDWTRPAAEIERQVRALSPRPGARFSVGGETWKLLVVDMTSGTGAPGEVIDDVPTIACGVEALRLRRVQRPGRKAMEASDALRGRPIPPGTRLS